MSTFQYRGVDSFVSAMEDRPFTPTGQTKKISFYDLVKKNLDKKDYPIQFWGRYIGGAQSLTTAEVEFLHERNCKILIIYNGTSRSSVCGSFQAGELDARNAITAATNLNIPAHVYIYANIDSTPPMNPSAEWIRGWWTKMFRSTYRGVGGIYCGLDISTNYCRAFEKVDSDAYKTSPDCPIRNLSMNSLLMLSKMVQPPRCHPNGFQIKQDEMKHNIVQTKHGWYQVDLTSASDLAFSGMW